MLVAIFHPALPIYCVLSWHEILSTTARIAADAFHALSRRSLSRILPLRAVSTTPRTS